MQLSSTQHSRMAESQAYCINLDSRPDKWKDTQDAFANSGISLKRFSGIRNAEGWRGCGASHVAIAREAIRLALPYVIIVEDDCIPSSDFAARWPAVLAALQSDSGWDMFLGGPTHVQGPISLRGSLIEIERGFALHFYVLKACAYEKAIAWNADRHGPIDVYYSDQFRVVTTRPVLAIQRPSKSDIRDEDMDYTEFFEETNTTLDKLLYSVRTRHATIILFGLSLFLIVLVLR